MEGPRDSGEVAATAAPDRESSDGSEDASACPSYRVPLIRRDDIDNIKSRARNAPAKKRPKDLESA
jgi:hypothetical protein